jgi:K+-sensing histidine kinase KdpD
MVGHDIRNPLQTMIGDLYLLQDDIDKIPEENTEQSAKETIEGINENTVY